MNFIAHYYIDRQIEQDLFVAGVCTPDWVSIFNRKVRVKEGRLPSLDGATHSLPEQAFHLGVRRHLEVDGLFHTSSFFKEETGILNRLFEQYLGPDQVPRSFFVAHVLFELVLDKVLIQADPSLLGDYYHHLDSCDLDRLVELTEWVTGASLPGYQAFIRRFITKKYLYQYTDWDHVVYVLRRILERVTITEYAFLYQDSFLQLLRSYEKGLADRYWEPMQGFGGSQVDPRRLIA
ncbi:MAG: hypothetical protein AAF804_03790 [Bacteroidota bacterium]